MNAFQILYSLAFVAIAIRLALAVAAMLCESYYHCHAVEYRRIANANEHTVALYMKGARLLEWNARKIRKSASVQFLACMRLERLADISTRHLLYHDARVYNARAEECRETSNNRIAYAQGMEKDAADIRTRAKKYRRAARSMNAEADANVMLRRFVTIFARV